MIEEGTNNQPSDTQESREDQDVSAIDVQDEYSDGLVDKDLSELTDDEAKVVAQRMGWKDKSNYNNDGRFVDAKEFIRRGREEMPVIKKRLSHFEKHNIDLQRKIDMQQQTMLEMKDLLTKNNQRAYERAKKDIESKISKAKSDYDLEAYDEALKEKEELDKDIVEKLENKQNKSTIDPVIQSWGQDPDNIWYHTNKQMQDEANAYYYKLELSEPSSSTFTKLNKTSKYIQRKFSDYFGIEPEVNDKKYNAVEGGNVYARNTGVSKHRYESIPSEERRIYDNMLRSMPFYGKKDKDSVEKVHKYKEDCVKNYYG